MIILQFKYFFTLVMTFVSIVLISTHAKNSIFKVNFSKTGQIA